MEYYYNTSTQEILSVEELQSLLNMSIPESREMVGDWRLIHDSASKPSYTLDPNTKPLTVALADSQYVAQTYSTTYPTSPTPAAKDNTTKVATTAFCKDFIKALSVSGKVITYTKSTGTTGTITTHDTTYSNFTKATDSAAGKAGLVPAPAKGYQTRYLKGTGGWATVSTSSDRRVKQQFADIPEAVLDVWEKVRWHQFKMNDEVEEHGEKALLHTGLVVQDLQELFKGEGLDADVYDMIAYEKCDDGGGFWSMRYEQALAVEAAYQRRRADRLEARLAKAEERLAALEDMKI